MSRRMGVVCAAALLWLAAGCSASSFFLSFLGPDGKQHVVSGSVDQVAANLQAALGRVGIVATLNQQGEDVRLVGSTRSGKRFALMLKRQTTNGSESTAVSVEWEKEADDQFWLTVVELLASPAPAK